MRRRDFVKFLTGGAAAVGLVGKDALKAAEVKDKAVEIGEIKVTAPSGSAKETAKKVKEEMLRKMYGGKVESEKLEQIVEEVNKYPILRIGQPTSTWCRDGLAVQGEWFMHNYGSKTCQKLTKDLVVTGIKPAGWRAVRFKEYKHGVGPVETQTNPRSPEFRAIQTQSSFKDGKCLWGPVFHVTFIGAHWHPRREETVELFCNSATMRRFADRQIIPHIDFATQEPYYIHASKGKSMLLSTVPLNTGRFHWYGAKLQTQDEHYESWKDRQTES